MKKYKIKIGKINLEKEEFTIISDNNLEFIGKINKGSVNFRVYNESKQEVNISYLEEGDIIKIYTNEQSKQTLNKNNKTDLDKLNLILTNQNNDNLINHQKNNIIINKILIKNKYVFNSDSSEEWNDLS